MVFGYPQRYVLGVGVICVITVIFKTKTQKSPPQSPPLEPFSKKQKIKPPIYMALIRYFPHWIGYRLIFVLVSYSLSIFTNPIKQKLKC